MEYLKSVNKPCAIRASGWILALTALFSASHSSAAEVTVGADSNYFSGWSFSAFPPPPSGTTYWYYMNGTGAPGPDVLPGGGGQTIGDFNGNPLTWTVDPPSRLITAGVWAGTNAFGNSSYLPLNIGVPAIRPGQGFLSRGTASFSSASPFRQGAVLFFQDVDGNEDFKFHFQDCTGNIVDGGDFDFLKISTSGTPSYFIEGTAPAQYWRVTSAIGNDPNTVNGIVIKSPDVCQIVVDGDKPSIGGSVNMFLGSPPNEVPTAVPTVSGTSPAVGSAVTGTYTYADVDNNAQDVSATGSIYKFVTSPSSTLTDSTTGKVVDSGPTGGNGATYTPVADDAGQYLYFCVTPIAAAGANPGLETCTPVGQVAKGSTVGEQPGVQPVPALSVISMIGLAGMLGFLGWRRGRTGV
ncbi:hypothetical protein [Comamonas sp. 4034]|uniref:hypothetical protein n=1 Tax=Comamonas sp. 4034 TaxID=3156455 RepID=UPI003D1E9799